MSLRALSGDSCLGTKGLTPEAGSANSSQLAAPATAADHGAPPPPPYPASTIVRTISSLPPPRAKPGRTQTRVSSLRPTASVIQL
jgi:hypothetical protein